MSDYDNRKDAWEGNAKESLQNFQQMTEDELLDLVKNRDRDLFFALWIALKEKGTTVKSGPVLIRALHQLDDTTLYLHRYHCCETLFHIFQIHDDTLFRDIVGGIDKVSVKKKNAALEKLQKQYAIPNME